MARLNYHHLYYFWRVANEGNLTQVARSIPVSQSALSAQIKQLEDYFGTPLFRRDGRKLEVSDAGLRVLAYANDIFARGEELESFRQAGLKSTVETLRIGMLTTLSRNFIDGLIAPLLANPRVRLSIKADTLTGLLNGLSKHQIDVALTNSDVKGSDEQIWHSQLIARRSVSVIGPAATRPNTDFPQGYANCEWVLPNRDHEVRRAFEGFCAQRGYEPKIKAESNDMAMLRLLTVQSGALAVLPKVVVRDELSSGKLVEYLELPNLHGDFYAITIKRMNMPEALQDLLQQSQTATFAYSPENPDSLGSL